MKIKKAKRNRRRAFAFWLAVLLWAEGTLGSVCAAPENVQENLPASMSAEEGQTPVGEEENAKENEAVSGEGEKPVEEEKPAPEEGEKPIEGEKPAPEEGEKPIEEEKPAPEEDEKPAEGEEPAPEETGQPTAGEKSAESVSENTPDEAEELLPERIPGAGEALGEPPVMTADGGMYGTFSYSSNVMSTQTADVSLQTPGQADIIARYKAYPWKLNVSNSYSENPSIRNPYKAGHLSGDSLENALNLLNFIRYVAGVPADVTLSEDYIELAQAGALVNCVNNNLSHEPTQPDGFPDDLFKKGYDGCSSSNIAWNYGNIAQSLRNGWMYDGDSSNISSMGHRRWVLNPSMKQTGFGAVGAYSAMYAFDKGGSSIKDYVAWPAQNMPVELMNGSGTPWTLSLGSDYQKAERAQVVVTLKNVSTGKTWTFSEKKQDGYFQVNTVGYGMPNCIIFRPNGFSYDKGNHSQFQVTVTGLKDQAGNEATLRYCVSFFSLADEPKEVEQVTLNTPNLHLLLDDAEGTEQGALQATLKPINAADKTLTWKSLDETVATVEADSVITADSVVTAKNVGETTVTVTAVNGVQAACTVKVSKYALSAEEIAYDEKTDSYSLAFTLQGGDPQNKAKKLMVKDGEDSATDAIQWSSENENVVTVDADGVVTPVGVGEAKVWANVENGLKILSCEVTVENEELPTMQLRESELTMNAGESRQLRVYLSPADTKWGKNGQNYIKWEFDQAGVAVFAVEGITAQKTVSGNTVTVTAIAAGKAKITAEIVNEKGEPVEGADEEQGKGRASCEVNVQQTAVLPAEADRPVLIALTNTQTILKDVALPAGWSWKYPDTSLKQFAGQRSKTFAAAYRPTEDVQPAETLLPVYFLTLESLSLRVKQVNGEQTQDVSVLESGSTAYCYVNYSLEDTLAQFEEKHDELKNNVWYQKQKKELLDQLEERIALTSSKPQTVAVETVKNAEGKTAVSVAKPGEAVLKAELKLGGKIFRASQKLTVVEHADTSFAISAIEYFRKSGETETYRYQGELSDFPTKPPRGISSRMTLRMAGTTKLTVKSSNSKVVTVKASAVKPTETGEYEIPLAVLAAGTAEITVTGNNPAKTSRTVTLVVTDACPGLSEETVTANLWRTVGTDFCLYAAKDAAGAFYEITSVTLTDDKDGQLSGKFNLTSGNASDGSRRDCSIRAKSDTGTGTYRMKLHVAAGGKYYDLPFTVKVVSSKPKCSVKQKNKLNLFYQDTKSLLTFDTEETVETVSLTGCNYSVQPSDPQGGYEVVPGPGATLKSVKKGNLRIKLEGWRELTIPFTVNVEKKAIKISPVTGTVTLYPNSGLTSARIGIKNPEALPWDDLTIAGYSAKAKGNYEPKVRQEEQAVLLEGKNLNQAESFRMTIRLRSANWTESVELACNVKVNLRDPAIVLEKRTLQLNANDAYMGYDAAATGVRWKDGGDILTTQNVRVSVYCKAGDAKAAALVQNSQVIFTVEKENGCYVIKARLNNKTVGKGNYQYVVQAAKDGKIWRTALTLKVVDTAPDKAVKIAAKGSIDVLNREGSFMTLTPSLKAVNGTFDIPADRVVKLEGRDAHLFRAVWSVDGKTLELRAKNKETLVTNYQYTVTPVLAMRNVKGVTEEIRTAPVKFKVKQGSVKASVLPKSALMYSGTYNSVPMDMKVILKGAEAPEIENVVLVGNTDAFTYVYNKEGQGTLTMKDTGRAVKGKGYSLQFQIFFAERADNVKPVTVRFTVKVK